MSIENKIYCGVSFVVVFAGLCFIASRVGELSRELTTVKQCLGPAEDRPLVPEGGAEPCAAITKLEADAYAAGERAKDLEYDCAILATSCVRLTGVVDDTLHSFVRSHVEPAQVARAKAGLRRYQARQRRRAATGMGGGED